jgi:hypothetical protein
MADTAATIISASFDKIGIATPTSAQNTSALSSLNSMISLMGADFLPPYITRYSASLTIADAEYTIGSSGNFNTTRPLKIEGAFLRDSSSYDHQLQIVSAKDYNEVFSKGTTAKPQYLYYQPEYPLGKIILDAGPEQAYDLYLDMWVNFTEFALSSTAVTLPPEYKAFLVYNLAVSLAEDWDRNVSKTLYAMAKESRDIIERLNASVKPIPTARFDVPMYQATCGYDVVTDDTIDGGSF